MPFNDDSVGSNDQQAPQGLFAHFRRGSEPLFATRGMLSWCEPGPGRKIPGLEESFGRQRKGRYGRRDQRADIGHRHQAPQLQEVSPCLLIILSKIDAGRHLEGAITRVSGRLLRS